MKWISKFSCSCLKVIWVYINCMSYFFDCICFFYYFSYVSWLLFSLSLIFFNCLDKNKSSSLDEMFIVDVLLGYFMDLLMMHECYFFIYCMACWILMLSMLYGILIHVVWVTHTCKCLCDSYKLYVWLIQVVCVTHNLYGLLIYLVCVTRITSMRVVCVVHKFQNK